MRQKWFAKLIIIILVICMIADIGARIANRTRMKNWYGMTAVVTHVSEATDTVTIKDFNDNLWQFKGVEDWSVNDIASCVMDSCGTSLIKDDVIVKVQYSGYFEGWAE